MKNNKMVLISIATYKEAENIENLINKIRKSLNWIKILRFVKNSLNFKR